MPNACYIPSLFLVPLVNLENYYATTAYLNLKKLQVPNSFFRFFGFYAMRNYKELLFIIIF